MKNNPPLNNYYLETIPWLKEILPTLSKKTLKQPKDIIVFSHLRWEFVKQRPQHLLERLAKNRNILFVEEPISYNSTSYGTAKKIKINSKITVIQPRIQSTDSFSLNRIIKKYSDQFTPKPVLWFYSASFVNMILLIPHSLVVYDCMDELSQFKGAAKKIVQQEKKLFQFADVVFTGGHSLYNSKKRYHQNIHSFPSSVDSSHFAKALRPQTKVPDDLEKISQPRVGYYGVLDERIDLKLIKQIAQLLPNISFVMIGPVAKIDEQDLPKANNIYYLGEKNYRELPGYLKGFDIAYMPFAINKATEFISPTKTLEYMAAYKPIISTPIKDVINSYSSVVSIVNNAQQLKKAIEKYLAETVIQQRQRIKLQKRAVAKTSWDKTAETMSDLIDQGINKFLSSLEEEEFILSKSISQPIWY